MFNLKCWGYWLNVSESWKWWLILNCVCRTGRIHWFLTEKTKIFLTIWLTFWLIANCPFLLELIIRLTIYIRGTLLLTYLSQPFDSFRIYWLIIVIRCSLGVASTYLTSQPSPCRRTFSLGLASRWRCGVACRRGARWGSTLWWYTAGRSNSWGSRVLSWVQWY